MKETKIYGSLARRVALVFLVLVILPLLLYVGFLWHRDSKIKMDAALSDMRLVGKFSEAFLDQWYDESLVQLEALSMVSEEDRDTSTNLMQNLSTILVFNSQGECIYSNRKELIGRRDFYPEILQKTANLKAFLFIGKNPVTNKKELFLFERKDNEIWGLSVDLERWMKPFSNLKNIGFPITLRFVSIQHADKKKKEIVLKLPAANATFDIQVSLAAKEIKKYAGGGFFSHVFVFLALIICIGGIGAIWLITRIARPFRKLYQVMEEVRNENYEQKYEKDRFGFEINVLGENFNQMLETLLHNMETAKELEIGRKVQNQLLPEKIPEFPGLTLGKAFVPAKEVAGDFYDLFVRGENELLLAIADGSGKGISACLYSLMVRSMLRSHATADEGLEDIVRRTNNLFCRDTGDTGNFVTAWVGIYRSDSHTLQYTSCGHLPAVYLDSEGKLQELATEGIAFGVIEIDQVQVKSISLSPGCLLFLYSDGVTEAQNEKGELFGKSRLLEFLISHRSLEPQMLIDRLIATVDQFAGDSIARDDLTVLCFKVH